MNTALDTKALAETQIEFDHVPPGLIEEIITAWNRRISPSQGEGPAADVVEALRGAKVIIEMMERPAGLGAEVEAALDRRLAAINAILASLPSTGVKVKGQQFSLPIEKVECVSWEKGYEEPADPIWRIVANGYCADFPTETAANNFRNAVLSCITPSVDPAGTGVVEALRKGWEYGRMSWCPAGILADTERTERDWAKALTALASIAPQGGEGA